MFNNFFGFNEKSWLTQISLAKTYHDVRRLAFKIETDFYGKQMLFLSQFVLIGAYVSGKLGA
jgi:hypothetical protein